MNEERKRLVRLGQALACIGIERETARRALEELVTRGVPYTSEEMLQAVQRFQWIEAKWTEIEAEYLTLRKQIGKR